MTSCDKTSHVTKHERAEICLFSVNVKLRNFFSFFFQKQNICVSFCHLKEFSHFCLIFFMHFSFFKEVQVRLGNRVLSL